MKSDITSLLFTCGVAALTFVVIAAFYGDFVAGVINT